MSEEEGIKKNINNPVNNSNKIERNADGTLKPGSLLNPKGRPKNALGFATIFKKFIKTVAEKNEITEEEVEQQLLKVAYGKAIGGDYNFYRDIFDRVYGKPNQPIEVERKEHVDIQRMFEELEKKDDTNTKQ